MVKPTEKVALFDLDGTLADYDQSMREKMALLGMKLPLDRERMPPVQDYARKLIQSQSGFWRDLPRHMPGFEILNCALQIGFSPMILTQGPMSTPSAWTEKIEWCAKHVPNIPVTITRNKSLVYGRVLVDDWPPYFMEWLKVRPRGIVICPEHPWNKEVHDEWCTKSTRDRVVVFNGSNAQEVVHALTGAFNR